MGKSNLHSIFTNCMKGVSKILLIAFFAIGLTNTICGQKLPYAEHLLKNEVSFIQVDSTSFPSLTNVFYKPVHVESMPIFCRMEELVYRKSNINFRFNLGSNDYVKKLEGK